MSDLVSTNRPDVHLFVNRENTVQNGYLNRIYAIMSDAGNQSKWDSLVGSDGIGGDEDDEDDDVHVCGGCKQQFSKIEVFVSHKRECRAKKRKKAEANSSSRVSVIVDLGKEVGYSYDVNLEHI